MILLCFADENMTRPMLYFRGSLIGYAVCLLLVCGISYGVVDVVFVKTGE